MMPLRSDADPVSLFVEWHEAQLRRSRQPVPSAGCLSTVGTDGYPNARFVDLKEVRDGRWVVTGSTRSRKGSEMGLSSRVALTFWWPETGRQVRMQGDARPLPDDEADRYFRLRPRDAQLVSHVSDTGAPLADPGELERRLEEAMAQHEGQAVARPPHWGAYAIEPLRIEFLAFSESRFHERILFVRQDGRWQGTRLQP